MSDFTESNLNKLAELAADNYYNKSKSIISDDLYENITDIREVNYDKHLFPMLSISKKELDFKDFIVTPKLDGVSLELIYIRKDNSYKLKQVLTRGGEPVDKNKIEGIITDFTAVDDVKSTNTIVIRGEVIAPYVTKNHRNVVSGNLNGNISNDILLFIPYFIADGDANFLTETFDGDLLLLQYLGFIPISYCKNCNPDEFLLEKLTSELQSTVEKFLSSFNSGATRADILTENTNNAVIQLKNPVKIAQIAQDITVETPVTIATDGLVVRDFINDFYSHTDKYLKFAYAVKFQMRPVPAVIVGIHWNISKNRILTPVADLLDIDLNPLIIDDKKISKASLKSLDFVRNNNVHIGQVVEVILANQIIPEIVNFTDIDINDIDTDSAVELRSKPDLAENIGATRANFTAENTNNAVINSKSNISSNQAQIAPVDSAVNSDIIPKTCPRCGSILVENGIYLQCPNLECGVDKSIEYFAKILRIKGLGIKTIEKLHLKNLLDIFTADYSSLGANGIKIKKQLDNLQATDAELITAMNPPGIALATAKKIDINNIDRINLGAKTTEAFKDWWDSNSWLFYELRKYIKPKSTTQKISTIAISGVFDGFTHSELVEFLKDYEVKSNITKSCKYLVVGHNPSESKLKKACKLGIQIVSLKEFLSG